MTTLSDEFNEAYSPEVRPRRVLPGLIGFVGALALIGLYLAILSLLQSPVHAFGQLTQIGFGWDSSR